MHELLSEKFLGLLYYFFCFCCNLLYFFVLKISLVYYKVIENYIGFCYDNFCYNNYNYYIGGDYVNYNEYSYSIFKKWKDGEDYYKKLFKKTNLEKVMYRLNRLVFYDMIIYEEITKDYYRVPVELQDYDFKYPYFVRTKICDMLIGKFFNNSYINYDTTLN